MGGAWNERGAGQVLVGRVRSDVVEKLGFSGLGGTNSESFKSIPLKGLVERLFEECTLQFSYVG